jgi:hypothetical protein
VAGGATISVGAVFAENEYELCHYPARNHVVIEPDVVDRISAYTVGTVRVGFWAGAVTSSFIFFATLRFGARLL